MQLTALTVDIKQKFEQKKSGTIVCRMLLLELLVL